MLERLAAILREAGRLLLTRRESGAFTFERRAAATVSASVDIEAHEFLVRELSLLLPGTPVLSEEDGAARRGQRPEEYWLIDPLDGTASFVDGYAGFVTQVALMRACRPVLSGVYAPAFEQMFLAEERSGAECNGSRLRVSARPATRWILTDNYPKPRGIAAELMRVMGIPTYLECGSIGLKICRVADGSADVCVKDVTVRDWDVAAPQLVLTEAGGALGDITGVPFAYSGDFERQGLIAGASAGAVARILEWRKQREQA